ncbi:MAG TPA: DEAD/DEAH box helicase [Candidatus Nanoarchaeia archaeon]|nr:DEAD/DEAH box helicase [Candidatus Nanoarchaeia archaeon]
MQLKDIQHKIPQALFSILKAEGIDELRPCQEKAIKAGLLEGKNLLICTPTASGKTLIAELAGLKVVLEQHRKMIYIVPLKALGSEKFREFKRKYSAVANVALSMGDFDSDDSYLASYDVIIATAEKLDSLLRHQAPWIEYVSLVVVDEVHLLNDPGRGPTLEILLTLLKERQGQILALSATIGNPQELADWLKAELVEDSWRPVKLKEGVYYNGKIRFKETE